MTAGKRSLSTSRSYPATGLVVMHHSTLIKQLMHVVIQ